MQKDPGNGRRTDKWENRGKGEGIYLGEGKIIALFGRSQVAPSRISDRNRTQVMRNSCLIRGPRILFYCQIVKCLILKHG